MATFKKTELTPGAVPGRLYGTFAGKFIVPSREKLTQLSPGAVSCRRYGSFAGKTVGGGGVGLNRLYIGWSGELPFKGRKIHGHMTTGDEERGFLWR